MEISKGNSFIGALVAAIEVRHWNPSRLLCPLQSVHRGESLKEKKNEGKNIVRIVLKISEEKNPKCNAVWGEWKRYLLSHLIYIIWTRALHSFIYLAHCSMFTEVILSSLHIPAKYKDIRKAFKKAFWMLLIIIEILGVSVNLQCKNLF